MTKLLNVDALESDQRTLQIAGVEYKVLEMNVENFIATSKDAEQLQDSGAPLTRQIESAVDLIRRSVPDCPREVLMAVPLRHLQVIVGFVRGDEVEASPEAGLAQIEKDVAAAVAAGKGAKKPRVRK